MIDLPKPKLIIFDCDGTLVNTEELAGHAFTTIVNAYGAQLTPEHSEELFIGITYTDSRPIVEKMYGIKIPDTFLEEIIAKVHELRPLYQREIPGALEGMIACSKILPVAVGSNGEMPSIRASLELAGFLKALPDLKLYNKDMVARAKPAPDLYLYVAEQFGIDPKDCWVVEDTVPGATAGVDAGMTVLGITACAHDKAATGRALLNAGAAYVFEDYKDFPLAILSDS